MSAEHHRRLENMYRGAPINALYQPAITIGDGSAEVVVAVKPTFFHAAGALHGSVYFKVLDDACFFAVASKVEDAFVVTASFTTYITRPVTGGTLTARGRAVHVGKTLFLAEAVVTDDAGAEVARGNGSFMRSKITLGPELGYR